MRSLVNMELDVVITLEALRVLAEKYREMRTLRLADAQPGAHDPTPEMQHLAARFPGALREIDHMPMEELERRQLVLENISRVDAAPAWAKYSVAYHAWMRIALRAKRLARAYPKDAELLDALRDAAPHPDGEPEPEAITIDFVANVRHPPQGRLNRWVLERLAQATGETVASMDEILFGAAHLFR